MEFCSRLIIIIIYLRVPLNLSVGTLSFVGAPISNGRAIIFYKQRISDTNDKGYFIIVE